MGKSHSKADHSDFYLDIDEWEQVTQSDIQTNNRFGIDQPITLRHRINGELVDAYYPSFISHKQYEDYKENLQFRRNQKNIVRALYYKPHVQKEFCSTSYGMTVFTQHVKGRLSQYKDIPLRDSLYCMNGMLDGYKKLYNTVGRFYISEDQIIIDQNGQVRVWLNSNFSKNYPQESDSRWNKWDGSQYEMVQDIVGMIIENTDETDGPRLKFSDFYQRQKIKYGNQVGFDDAKRVIYDYSKINDIEVPNVFESVLQIYQNEDIQMLNENQYVMNGNSQVQNYQDYPYDTKQRSQIRPQVSSHSQIDHRVYQNITANPPMPLVQSPNTNSLQQNQGFNQFSSNRQFQHQPHRPIHHPNPSSISIPFRSIPSSPPPQAYRPFPNPASYSAQNAVKIIPQNYPITIAPQMNIKPFQQQTQNHNRPIRINPQVNISHNIMAPNRNSSQPQPIYSVQVNGQNFGNRGISLNNEQNQVGMRKQQKISDVENDNQSSNKGQVNEIQIIQQLDRFHQEQQQQKNYRYAQQQQQNDELFKQIVEDSIDKRINSQQNSDLQYQIPQNFPMQSSNYKNQLSHHQNNPADSNRSQQQIAYSRQYEQNRQNSSIRDSHNNSKRNINNHYRANNQFRAQYHDKDDHQSYSNQQNNIGYNSSQYKKQQQLRFENSGKYIRDENQGAFRQNIHSQNSQWQNNHAVPPIPNRQIRIVKQYGGNNRGYQKDIYYTLNKEIQLDPQIAADLAMFA